MTNFPVYTKEREETLDICKKIYQLQDMEQYEYLMNI